MANFITAWIITGLIFASIVANNDLVLDENFGSYLGKTVVVGIVLGPLNAGIAMSVIHACNRKNKQLP